MRSTALSAHWWLPWAFVRGCHRQARSTEQPSGSEMLGDLPRAHSQEEGFRSRTRVCLTLLCLQISPMVQG